MARLARGLVIALVAAGASACGSSGNAAPVVVAGAPAAVIVELAGKVEAMRGGQLRVLAAGQELSGDDEVRTGADGSITLRLLHNDAIVTLPSGRTEVLSRSPAWALAKASTMSTGIEISAAAGRHTGEQEVDTGVTSTGTFCPSRASE